MIENENNEGNVQRASGIYIDEGNVNVTIKDSDFSQNHVSFIQDHIKKVNMDLFNYFQPEYFNASFSQMINIHSHIRGETKINIKILNNSFSNQRNQQILGYPQKDLTLYDMAYYASILSIKSQSRNLKVDFSGNSIYNCSFMGIQTALISHEHAG